MSTFQLPTGVLSHAQDAVEYFQHLLKVVDRTERSAAERLGGPSTPPTTAAFTFLASAHSVYNSPLVTSSSALASVLQPLDIGGKPHRGGTLILWDQGPRLLMTRH